MKRRAHRALRHLYDRRDVCAPARAFDDRPPGDRTGGPGRLRSRPRCRRAQRRPPDGGSGSCTPFRRPRGGRARARCRRSCSGPYISGLLTGDEINGAFSLFAKPERVAAIGDRGTDRAVLPRARPPRRRGRLRSGRDGADRRPRAHPGASPHLKLRERIRKPAGPKPGAGEPSLKGLFSRRHDDAPTSLRAVFMTRPIVWASGISISAVLSATSASNQVAALFGLGASREKALSAAGAEGGSRVVVSADCAAISWSIRRSTASACACSSTPARELRRPVA